MAAQRSYIYNVPDLQVDVARQMGFMKETGFSKAWPFIWKIYFFVRRGKCRPSRIVLSSTFASAALPREQITFLPNGADTNFLKPQPASRELLDRWQLHGKKVFLYVGTHAFTTAGNPHRSRRFGCAITPKLCFCWWATDRRELG